jgi:hypothetical protein
MRLGDWAIAHLLPFGGSVLSATDADERCQWWVSIYASASRIASQETPTLSDILLFFRLAA